MDSPIEQQRRLYGAPLAERFGQVMEKYALSQRSLAQVLGLSAPMLSQLMGAKRIKIGNPAVLGRLMMLEARSDEADLQAVLQQAELLDAATATHGSAEAGEGATASEYLRSVGSPEVLAEMAGLARARGHEQLAEVLERAAR
ncbi:DNA-binding protein [Glutamicibacter nicotianae]